MHTELSPLSRLVALSSTIYSTLKKTWCVNLPPRWRAVVVEAYALQISKLEHERDQKRKLVENLLHQKFDIEKKLKETEKRLVHLDESIETLERKQYNIKSLTAPVVVKSEPDNVKTEPSSSSSLLSFPPTQAQEILTDPQQTQTQAEEILTEPTTQRYEEEVEHDNDSTNFFAQ